MTAKKPLFSWKNKLGLFISFLFIFFLIFDFGSLTSINSAVTYSDIGEYHLYEIKGTLYKLFMAQIFRFFLTAGAGFGIIYWILSPHWQFLQKFKDFADRHPQLKPLVKGKQIELNQANDILETISNTWSDNTENNSGQRPK